MVYKRLYVITADDYIFDVELRGRIVVVDGFSGSGKTLLCDIIMNKQLIPKSLYNEKETDLSDIVVINVFSRERVNKLQDYSGKLIIIDNADVLLDQSIADYISKDLNNQYLIYSRSNLEFYISPNYYAYFKLEGKVFTLHYRYSEQGWF